MKTLSEIQNDIKSLSIQLNQLAINIQNVRLEVNKNDMLDMKKIKYISQKYPIEGHGLASYDDYIKKRYLTVLVLTARLQQSEIEKSLLLISRIAYGAGYQDDIADIMKDSYTLSERSMEEIIDSFCSDRIKMLLILDMLLISAEKKKNEVLQFIAEISYMLGISENEMKFLSNLAIIVLQNDINQYVDNSVICDPWGDIFQCYLKGFTFKRNLIKVPRNVLIGLGDMDYQVILDIKEDEGILVEEGSTICLIRDNVSNSNQSPYESSMDRKLEKKMSDIKDGYKLCSPEKGKIYIFRNIANQENLSVGIVTHPLDSIENARAWFGYII